MSASFPLRVVVGHAAFASVFTALLSIPDYWRAGGDPARAVVSQPQHDDLRGRRAAFWRDFRGVVLHFVLAVA